jgi:hypothetical protein
MGDTYREWEGKRQQNANRFSSILQNLAFIQKYHYFRSCIYTCINLHNDRSHGEYGHHRRTEHQKLKGIGN